MFFGLICDELFFDVKFCSYGFSLFLIYIFGCIFCINFSCYGNYYGLVSFVLISGWCDLFSYFLEIYGYIFCCVVLGWVLGCFNNGKDYDEVYFLWKVCEFGWLYWDFYYGFCMSIYLWVDFREYVVVGELSRMEEEKSFILEGEIVYCE